MIAFGYNIGAVLMSCMFSRVN